MDDYLEHDAVGLADLVRTKQVSPAELLEAAQARADAVNPRINAIVRRLDPPVSRAGAEGPFYGVPFLFKDLDHHLAGHPTGAGSRAWQSYLHTENDVVSDRWLAAGLVVFGRTNTPEFGAKGITEPLVGGPTRNPWNLDHAPGGSSGGSAAAVAAGIVPCSAASDGGGSIRIPASACGVFGLKATRGLIPAGPQIGEGLLGSVSNGVHSRSVRDTAAMLDLLAGPSPTSPYLAARPATTLLQEMGRDPGVLRVAVCTDIDQMITQNLGWVPYTQLANLTGLPAMSVPLHWTPAGLPIGSQFVGRLGSEAMLLRLASQLEAAQPWWHRRPPL